MGLGCRVRVIGGGRVGRRLTVCSRGGCDPDIFESVAAEIIGAMILGGVLAQEVRGWLHVRAGERTTGCVVVVLTRARELGLQAGLESATPFVFFPVVIHAFDVLVSSVAILSVGRGPEADPMAMLMRGVAACGCPWSVPC